tara:strand:+ start:1217 stop:1951 length:735 start_codon:yes stop_codon:yes gene_type:complete
MSFSKKFINKSPIKKTEDGNPIIDFLPTLVKEGGKFVKSQIAKNISPRGYYDPLGRVSRAVVGIPEEGSVNKDEYYKTLKQTPDIVKFQDATKERQDLFSLMMTGKTPNNAVQVSKYKPTKSKDPNAIYYNSPTTENFLKEQIKKGEYDISKWPKKGSQYFGDSGNVLGNYTVNKGIDKDGREYFSYYDVWDLNPFQGKGIKDKLATTAQEAIGVKPAEVYGRVYVDEVVEEPWQKKMENKNKL